jgi:hypothetical protein
VRKRGRERKRQRDKERVRKRERKRERERDVEYGCFILGMTGALAPFSYLVYDKTPYTKCCHKKFL